MDPKTTIAFNNIYDSTNKKVLGLITAKCGNPSDINDIFQETYMELYAVLAKRGLHYIEDNEAFITKIAKSKIYGYYSLLEKLKIFNPLSTTSDNEEEIDIVDLNTLSVEAQVSESLLIEQISQHIRKKSNDIRKIFYLFYSLDMSIPQIANMLSMNESSIKNKLYRTIKELRKKYQ